MQALPNSKVVPFFNAKKRVTPGALFFSLRQIIKRGAPTNAKNHVDAYHVRNETKNNEKRRLKK